MKSEDHNNTPSGGKVVKLVLQTCGRGLVYAVCFLAAYAVLYRPLMSGSTGSTTSTATASYEQQQADQVRVYQEQVARATAMYEETERQQKRMGEILTKQEEQVKRLDAVISAWEKQSGVKR